MFKLNDKIAPYCPEYCPNRELFVDQQDLVADGQMLCADDVPYMKDPSFGYQLDVVRCEHEKICGKWWEKQEKLQSTMRTITDTLCCYCRHLDTLGYESDGGCEACPYQKYRSDDLKTIINNEYGLTSAARKEKNE